jgi:hypothetical protein
MSRSETHTDESRVPDYTLPDPLRRSDGPAVRSARDWRAQRAHILELFRSHVYGRVPRFAWSTGITTEECFPVLGGSAEATQRRVRIESSRALLNIELLDVLPSVRTRRDRVPIIVALNFGGNHSVLTGDRIWLPRSWIDGMFAGVVDNRATDAGRGTRAEQWPLDLIIGAGFGLATAVCADIDPDFDDGFENGAHALVHSGEPGQATDGLPADTDSQSPIARDVSAAPGNTRPGHRAPDAWGTIAAWAWGLSRIVDVLETDERIDPNRIVVLGHSRMGKTALWAGAQDQRFAAVISNESGCGGAALSRREFGETIGAITAAFPHWFCERFATYPGRADALPVDQHMLIGLIAPRPAYVASAAEDLWADPKGEYLSVYHAGPVYHLFGRRTVRGPEPPPVGETVGDRVSYHCRPGTHDITRFDWERYLEFLIREL